ncbi:hypothetical protein Tco_0500825 [Tanacetum coccineum]
MVQQAMGEHRIELGMPMQCWMKKNYSFWLVIGYKYDKDVNNHPVQDLALNEDNIFQAYECDAFDSDVDDEPTA